MKVQPRLHDPRPGRRRLKSAAAVTLAASLLGSAFGAPAAFAAIGDEITVVSIKETIRANSLWLLGDGSGAYCLDHDKGIPPVGVPMTEVGWDSYYGVTQPWNEDPAVRGNVLWVLSHSYPELTAAEVSALTGLPTMTENDLIDATQEAIWHFTNSYDHYRAYVGPSADLYRWLVDHATPLSPNDPDGGVVDLAEGAPFSNVAGQPIGPFEVSTDNVAVVNLTATPGSTIVDETGAPVSAAVDGDEVWLEADAPQSATITAKGTYVHHAGTVWHYAPQPAVAQELSRGSSVPLIRQDSITFDIVDVPVVPEPPVVPTEDNPAVSTVATDKADGDQVLPAGGGTVTDEVLYTGLLAGKEYTLTGELRDKATGASTGITASKTFTPTATDGSVFLDFAVTPGYEGTSLVAFEVVSDTVGEIASHEDIDSAAQTVSVDVPVIPEPPVVPEPEPTEDNPTVVTLATDKADGDQVLPAGGGTVTDEVLYTGLLAGKEYTLTGELMDKATGAATGITGTKTFTPTAADGSVFLDFAVPADYAGKALVAFEVISDTQGEIASHTDIDSVEQTVSVVPNVVPPVEPEPEPTEVDPSVVTLATDKADGDQVLPAGGGTVTDEVLYTGLLAGKEYTLTGELMDKATGAATGITASKTFTPADATGSVFLDFAVTPGYEGASLVAFEVISDTAGEIASHEDIDSTEQTVSVDVPVIPEPPVVPEEPEEPVVPTEDNPSVATLATDKADGDQLLPAAGGTVTDEVLYSGLVPDKRYTLTGELMDKATGAATGITSTMNFYPGDANGTVLLDFVVPAGYGGSSMVAFEVVSDTNGEIASHTDITSVAQTVTVDAPVVPEEPVTPPVTPEEPVTPPVTPEEPVTPPVVPEEPVTPPVVPEEPVTPPVVPEEPVTPPVTPEDPVTPPVTPEDPVTPPVTPEEPVNPPVTPEDPSTPEEPVTPEIPGTPDEPVTPDEPASPVDETEKLAVTGGQLPLWLMGGAVSALGLGLGLLAIRRRRASSES